LQSQFGPTTWDPPMNNECTIRIETAKLRIIKIIFLMFLLSSLFEWSD